MRLSRLTERTQITLPDDFVTFEPQSYSWLQVRHSLFNTKMNKEKNEFLFTSYIPSTYAIAITFDNRLRSDWIAQEEYRVPVTRYTSECSYQVFIRTLETLLVALHDGHSAFIYFTGARDTNYTSLVREGVYPSLELSHIPNEASWRLMAVLEKT